MHQHAILLADDMRTDSKKDLRRSRLLEKLAVELGRRLSGGVDILYVEDVGPVTRTPQDKFWKAELILSLNEEQSKYPVPVDFFIQSGAPAEAILKWKPKGQAPQLILVGTRGYRGLKKTFLGSVSEEVVRNSAAPVLVMGPEAQKREYVLSPRKRIRLLVMTDLEPSSLPAETFALHFAKQTEAQVTLCYSVGDQIRKLRTMYYSQGGAALNLTDLFSQMQDDAQVSLQRKVEHYAKAGHQMRSLLLTEESLLEKTLPREAGKGYDFVVMGTRSRNKFLTAFVGSAARGAILKAPIPVIIVRSSSAKNAS